MWMSKVSVGGKYRRVDHWKKMVVGKCTVPLRGKSPPRRGACALSGRRLASSC